MTWSRVVLAAALIPLAMLSPRGAWSRSTGYTILNRFSPGGEGGWDLLALDPGAHRLYVSRSTRVQVLDVNSGKLVGEIPDTPGVHGIALAPELGRGYTSNGRDSSVTVFDLRTLATLAKIHLDARNPDVILYEPESKRVFCFNGGSDNAVAIDAAAGRVEGSIALGGRPELAVADGRGRVFVNLEDSSAVVSFDARTLVLGERWPLAPGEEPTGLALDPVHRRLFAGCSNQRMVILDADSGRLITNLPIGKGVDGVAFDPGRRLAFSSNGEGTLTVVHEDSPSRFSLVGDAPTQARARTLALDPKTHRIYLPTATFGEPPAATAENPHPRPPMIPGSFVILVLGR